jgi:hypothetical protein
LYLINDICFDICDYAHNYVRLSVRVTLSHEKINIFLKVLIFVVGKGKVTKSAAYNLETTK